jgi:hypothetical protein
MKMDIKVRISKLADITLYHEYLLTPLPLVKRLLLVRPNIRSDRFTRLSHGWAELVKTKAIDEGWHVEDLSGARATRRNVETALSRTTLQRPSLIIHYDHGTEFTLYGNRASRPPHSFEDLVPVIDESNISMTAGMFVSAMACLSASGLGPLAIYERASGYLGYTNFLCASLDREVQNRFGEAVNAPNFALLEGRSPSDAFEIGYRAWDQLCSELLEENRFFDWAFATINRDYFSLLVP